MENLLFDFIAKYIHLTAEEKNALISLNIFKTVEKGTILLSAGKISNKSYFVLKGCIRTYYIQNGEERTTAFYTEMEGITPHCVFTKKASEYYIASVEDSILTISNPEIENEMFEKFPKFETLCRCLSEEVIFKQQLDFDDFKTSSPEQRYVNMLKKRPELLQRVPQYQLASFLGITPQSLSRLRARITENGR